MTTPDHSPLTHYTRIALIGGGHMARSLIGGLIGAGIFRTALTVGEPNAELAAGLKHDFGVAVGPDNAAAVQGAAAWVLAVKPQVMKAVCEPLRDIAQASKPLPFAVGFTHYLRFRWGLRGRSEMPLYVGRGVLKRVKRVFGRPPQMQDML